MRPDRLRTPGDDFGFPGLAVSPIHRHYMELGNFYTARGPSQLQSMNGLTTHVLLQLLSFFCSWSFFISFFLRQSELGQNVFLLLFLLFYSSVYSICSFASCAPHPLFLSTCHHPLLSGSHLIFMRTSKHHQSGRKGLLILLLLLPIITLLLLFFIILLIIFLVIFLILLLLFYSFFNFWSILEQFWTNFGSILVGVSSWFWNQYFFDF